MNGYGNVRGDGIQCTREGTALVESTDGLCTVTGKKAEWACAGACVDIMDNLFLLL